MYQLDCSTDGRYSDRIYCQKSPLTWDSTIASGLIDQSLVRRNEATLERNVIFIKFSSLTAPKAAPIDAILTNYDAASDDNFVKTTI